MPNIQEASHADWIKTGIRIQEEIDRNRMTYAQLAEYLTNVYYVTTSRQYVSKICKGETFPQLYTLKAMAEVFDCDVAYLLCEQDTRKREATDIRAYTGLSETASETLHSLQTGKGMLANQKMYARHVIPFLNQLLSNPEAVERFAGKLSVYAATADMKRNLHGTPDERTDMFQAGAVFELSRVIAEQAEALFASPKEPEKKPVTLPE